MKSALLLHVIMEHLTNQPTNQPTNPPTNQPTNRALNSLEPHGAFLFRRQQLRVVGSADEDLRGFTIATVIAVARGLGRCDNGSALMELACASVPITRGGSLNPSSYTLEAVRTMLDRPFHGGIACIETRGCHALKPKMSHELIDASSAKVRFWSGRKG